MRRLIRYLLATYKISCHGLQDIVSRRSAAMYPTEPGSFSASEVTVRMGRIRHTLPVLWHFRTMTPAFSVQYIRLSRPFLCASLRLASCLFMLHGTSPYTLSSIIIHFLQFHNTHSSFSFKTLFPLFLCNAAIHHKPCLYFSLPLLVPSFTFSDIFLLFRQCLSYSLSMSFFTPANIFFCPYRCLP